MKHMKKIISLILAMLMIVSLAVSVSADEIEKVKITMAPSETGAGITGHTYEVYQIFKGNVSELDGEKVLINAEFGESYLPAEGETVDGELEEFKEMDAGEALKYLKDKLSDTAYKTLDSTNGWTEEVETGYYLIKDVSTGLPESETKSEFILKVIGDVNIQSKHDSAPITEKKVDDVNDSTDVESEIEWHDSADHDIEDEIDFQLSAVLPSAIDTFRAEDEEYRFVFHDIECEGLDFMGVESVYIVSADGTKTNLVEGTDYTVGENALDTCDNTKDACTFHVVFNNLTQIDEAVGGATLVVEYKSKLTEDAVFGDAGNPNKMYGEFRNINTPEVPKYTPEDVAIVFTFRTEVNKVDPESNPLKGAEFKLEKFYFDEAGTAEYKVGTTTYKGNWREVDKTVDSSTETTFAFNGIDDGYYRVTETKAPDGYNKIDPFYFTVTADHDVESDDPKLTDLKATPDNEKVVINVSKKEGTTTPEYDGLIYTDVVNEQGVKLPETGGIGTTIFYIVGGLLAAAAIVLLVAKKRMSSAE